MSPDPTHTYDIRIRNVLLVSFLVRLIISFTVELGNDEVYYWTYSQHLQWNYFDHPPMIALLIRLFTLNLQLESFPVFLRLGSLFCSALSTYFLYRLTREIHNARAGYLAALMYTGSLYASVIAGLMIMPDSPQMVFWTLSLWALVRIQKENSWKAWIGFGLFSGLCILSKVHGAFLWIGWLAYLLSFQRKAFFSPKMYASLFITLLLSSPIFIWNFLNDFITYRFHSERVQIGKSGVSLLFFLRELSGQILYNNPVLVFLGIISIYWFRNFKGDLKAKKVLVLFNWIALPMILTVLAISLFRETLPHWAGPAYITLMPLTAIYFETHKDRKKVSWPIPLAIGLILLFLMATVFFTRFYSGTLIPESGNSHEFSDSLGMGDITLDLSGWEGAGKAFRGFIQNEMKKEGRKIPPPLLVENWFPGAHLAYYFARPIGMPVIGISKPWNLHQFLWSNKYILETKPDMDTCYALVLSNLPYNPVKLYSTYFRTIKPLGKFISYRGNPIQGWKISRNFYVYRLSGFKGKASDLPFAK